MHARGASCAYAPADRPVTHRNQFASRWRYLSVSARRSMANWANSDSVIATVLITVSDDAKTWIMKFSDRPPIPVRVVATGGDSVVTDAGPYPSTKRPGQSVTLLHSVSHFKGDHMNGTFQAYYSGGLVVEGKTEATRTK